jgi:hypothetical protein
VHDEDVVRGEACAEMEDGAGRFVGNADRSLFELILWLKRAGSALQTVDLAFDGHITLKVER